MKRFGIISVLCGLMPLAVGAPQCERPASDEDVAACLGIELRESDAEINRTYEALMRQLGDAEKKKLRDEQRKWLKERDSVCRLASREPDRERWYAVILSDQTRTLCVTRYTRVRTTELKQLEQRLKRADPEPAVNAAPRDPGAYQRLRNVPSRSGKWYFEVFFDRTAIARRSPTALWTGCTNAERASGTLRNIRPVDDGMLPERIGVALDLDDGRIYVRRDGEWRHGVPGSAKGGEVKLGRQYRCGIRSTVPLADLLDAGLVRLNFGAKPFDYAMPDGYRPVSGE